ncbi:hypothetical protein DLAC_03453 [Tieghemostelium lacteum]|uniref:Uncharacterized protein n=1 Tax=Tieghemostelium lacteum TaxID=361077 RepID=A0A152A2E5_TIELA|nr:hypothetical protein DLAC_03453 [Tieghemostelium lacteum]|eukprot:KYR00287.1 hypothetical protein DLAC_03453 [Tieghemostelium lacteum]
MIYNNLSLIQKKCIIPIKEFFKILCFCIQCANDGTDDDSDECKEPMTRVKLGYRGKDIWIETFGINFHQTFGKFSILLDQDDQVVPINKNGELFEPLDPEKKYRIVVNRFGSSDEKWKQFNQSEIEKIKNKKSKLASLKKSLSSTSLSIHDSISGSKTNCNEIEMENLNSIEEDSSSSSLDNILIVTQEEEEDQHIDNFQNSTFKIIQELAKDDTDNKPV